MEPAYLITWKPDTENKEKGWPEASLKKLYEKLRDKGDVQEVWRFSRHKGVKPGERVYLVRQGRRGQALLGFGHIVEAPKPSGARNARISFEALVNPTSEKVFATQDELRSITSQPGVWNTQSSGVLLPPDVALALAELAKRLVPVNDQKSWPSTSSNPDWTRDELILALDLYFREPSARGSKSHPECVRLSGVLNRLPIHRAKPRGTTFRNSNGVGMKLSNFLTYDPSYIGKGLAAGSHVEKEVWKTFATDRLKLQKAAEAIVAGASELASAGIEADEDDEGSEEGRILTRVHKMRERDSGLARKKKQKVLSLTGRLQCEACSFDFALVFGELGNGFAECHHSRPISTLKPGEKTKLSDLHIVCANCHRMLHQGKPWQSVAQLKVLRSAVAS